MEALAISAANLDTIERNLNSVAKELTGVIIKLQIPLSIYSSSAIKSKNTSSFTEYGLGGDI
mgnify:CR=1 FL=1